MQKLRSRNCCLRIAVRIAVLLGSRMTQRIPQPGDQCFIRYDKPYPRGVLLFCLLSLLGLPQRLVDR